MVVQIFINLFTLDVVNLKKESYIFLLIQNKCNVGYAFINMVTPSHIISFYEVCVSLTLFGSILYLLYFCQQLL